LSRWQAIEAGCELLLVGSVGQEVARQLLDGELVEGHVGVEGAYHPVAPDILVGIAVLLKPLLSA